MSGTIPEGFLNRLSDQIEIQAGQYTISEYGQEVIRWQTWRHVWAYLRTVSTQVPPRLSWRPSAYRVVVRGDAQFPHFFRVMWKNTVFVPTSYLRKHPKNRWIEFSMIETK
ncbi:MAG: hypothetical protein LBQ26_00510 [Holosporales bacterium]|jgi:uncharacterized protein YktB (UPF0637 family)|nr:hypothetical protein [Holosporales bacterium]